MLVCMDHSNDPPGTLMDHSVPQIMLVDHAIKNNWKRKRMKELIDLADHQDEASQMMRVFLNTQLDLFNMAFMYKKTNGNTFRAR